MKQETFTIEFLLLSGGNDKRQQIINEMIKATYVDTERGLKRWNDAVIDGGFNHAVQNMIHYYRELPSLKQKYLIV